MDIPGKRLFVAALGNGTIEVLDLTKSERTAQILRLEEPQGLYFDATRNRLYVASGGDGTLRIYNGTNLVLDDKIELGDDADNVRGDVHADRIFVGYGSGALAITTLTGQNLERIVLGSHPESFQLEQSGLRVFVNVPKETAVAVVDRTKKMVVASGISTVRLLIIRWHLTRQIDDFSSAAALPLKSSFSIQTGALGGKVIRGRRYG